MDLSALEAAVSLFLGRGVANSTARSYAAGSRRFIGFCGRLGVQPFPVTEHSLMLFVGDLASQGLKHQTLKCYLSAVRYSQIMHGLPDPFTSSLPLLDYTLKGIKRVQAERGASEKPRLPITPEILQVLKAAWVPGGGAGAPNREGAMLWAACCTAF